MPPAIVRGKHTDLGFDGATCHLHDTTDRFTRRPGIGSLLGSRTVPVEALAGVRFEPARGLLPARIRLLLRPGADPLLEVNQRGFHDVEHPYVLPLESCQQEPGRLMVARLEAAIASTGVAHVPSSRFLVAPPAPPPVSAKVHGGVVGFDGSLITIRNGWGWERRKVIPVTAVRMVQWVAESNWRSGQLRLHLHDQTLEWDAWQQAPPGSHDPLALASRDGERAILLAAAVAWTIGRAGGTTAPARTVSTAAPVVAGLAAEAPAARAVLEGVAGRAVLDSAAVTITARGVTRRIPLRAIDWIELVDVRYPPGEGYVRVHLEGAPSDLEVFDPWRDADTVVHTDDHAALEFAHQVTAAMDGLVPVAHPELIATRGDRPDLTRALGRASPRARSLTPALRILPLLLQPGEQIEVLEAADWKALLGLLVVTDRRVLMVAGEPVAELTWELPAAGTVSTWTPQDDRHHGALSLLTRSGTHLYVTGVWTPWRFTRVLSPAPHPGKAGHTP